MGITDGFNFDTLNAAYGSDVDLPQAKLQFGVTPNPSADSQIYKDALAKRAARIAAGQTVNAAGQTAKSAGGLFGSAEQYTNIAKPLIDKAGSITSGIGSKLAPYVTPALKFGGIASGVAGLYQAAGDYKNTINDATQGHTVGAVLNGVNTAADVAGVVPFGPVGAVARSYTAGRDAGGFLANQLLSDKAKDAIGGTLANADGSASTQEIQNLNDSRNFASSINSAATPQERQMIDARRNQQMAVDLPNRVDAAVQKNESATPPSWRNNFDENGLKINNAVAPTPVATPVSITSGINPNIYQGTGKDVAVDTGRGTFNSISSGGNNYTGPAYTPSTTSPYQTAINGLIGQIDNSTGGDIGDQVVRGLRNKGTLAKINDIGSLNAKANENQIAMGHLGVQQSELGIRRDSNLLHLQSNKTEERRADIYDRNSQANTLNRSNQIDNQAEAAGDRNYTALQRVGVAQSAVDNQVRKTNMQDGKNGQLTGGENIAYQNALDAYDGPTGAGYGKTPADKAVDRENIRKSFMAKGRAPSISDNLPSSRPSAPITPPSAIGTMPSGNIPVGQSSSSRYLRVP